MTTTPVAPALTPRERRVALVVGGQIQKRRENLRMSRRDLADTLGVTERAVYSWEAAERLPNVARLYDLGAALSVTAGYFLP